MDVRNIIAREEGRAQMIFVRCSKCGELVARYRLQDYYHQGKSFDSFLRSQGSQASDSGRQQLSDFSQIQREALQGYRQVLEQLREEGKEI